MEGRHIINARKIVSVKKNAVVKWGGGGGGGGSVELPQIPLGTGQQLALLLSTITQYKLLQKYSTTICTKHTYTYARAHTNASLAQPPLHKQEGSGDSSIVYLCELTENWCVQSNRLPAHLVT